MSCVCRISDMVSVTGMVFERRGGRIMQMNVLLVDDDILCVEGIRCCVDWKSLGVDRVFSAYSMAQAQKVLREQPVAIILSDVEMPKGSGLELLRWVREMNYRPVCVLLTSYATFQYAKQAIELGVMDYLMKPADKAALADTFARAVQKVREEQEKEQNQILAGYWNANEKKRVHRFWREVLEQEIEPDSRTIQEQARREHLVFFEENRYLPILLQIHREDGGTGWITRGEELQKELKQMVFDDWDQVVLAYNEQLLLTIVSYAGDFGQYRDALEKKLLSYIKECRRKRSAGISGYLGEFLEAGELACQYQCLLRAAKENVTEQPGIYRISEKRRAADYKKPPMDEWAELLENQRYGRCAEEMDKYLTAAVHEKRIDREILEQLFHDFQQLFYVAAAQKGLQAHLLFQDGESMQQYQNATVSVRKFREWILYMVGKLEHYVRMAQNYNTVAERTIRFIAEHLGDELDRKTLAENVFLSPDYLSRIFRQETGVSLSEYIIRCRMREAKRLLIETDKPVGDIAYQTGYANVAYFTKVFRERYGMSPGKFRREKGIVQSV